MPSLISRESQVKTTVHAIRATKINMATMPGAGERQSTWTHLGKRLIVLTKLNTAELSDPVSLLGYLSTWDENSVSTKACRVALRAASFITGPKPEMTQMSTTGV
jgi:hypothetical protein